ncbi:MAG: 50S ribosomal protein L11 methyltransferase [Candidatus Sumerlaeota bacterium]|nr:50S ribosomal protein L11 methyltransferase [Candidatus Sumerlaeota bacterium]
MSAEERWAKLILTIEGVEEATAAEIAGALVEECGALGATQESAPEGRGAWALFFPPALDRGQMDLDVQAFLVRSLQDAHGRVGVRWRWEEQPDEKWAVAWRVHFEPFDVGARLRIVPPWNCGEPLQPGRLRIVIDPGQGFGTGRHETTRLCLEALVERVGQGARVLDAGAGSGILSIAAALLGAGQVVAVENDPAANANARRNFELNGVAGRVRLIEGTPHAVARRDGFDLVVCNMLVSTFRPLLPRLAELVAEGGALVLSGFIEKEKDEVQALARANGGQIESLDWLDEWGRLVWRKE